LNYTDAARNHITQNQDTAVPFPENLWGDGYMSHRVLVIIWGQGNGIAVSRVAAFSMIISDR